MLVNHAADCFYIQVFDMNNLLHLMQINCI